MRTTFKEDRSERREKKRHVACFSLRKIFVDSTRPNMEGTFKDNPPMNMSSGELVGGGGEGIGKVENDAVNTLPTADTWDAGVNGLPKVPLVETTAPSVVSPATDTSGGMAALKVATTVLQPICLGDSPVMLPIHLQMAGAAGAQLGQMGAAAAAGGPYFMTSQGPVSLPLLLEQQVLQHLIPSVIPQQSSNPAAPLQNNVLCQNASFTFGLPPPPPPAPLPTPPSFPALELKSAGAQGQDPNLLSLLQNPAFAAILQDLFLAQGASSACQSPGSAPADPFASAFLPPSPLTHPYSSPLAPLVPPATLLVPYPVVVPLPVPLPIPLLIPIPIPQTEDTKGNPPKPVCTVSKSTQTSNTKDSTPTFVSPRGFLSHPLHPLSPSSLLSAEEGEVLDLSVRACPVVPKQEFLCPAVQDNVLDLSVGGARGTCIQSFGPGGSRGGGGGERGQSCQASPGAAMTLGLLRPVECTQRLDSKLLSGLASLEFSRQHKWLVDNGGAASGSSALSREAALSGTRNLEIVGASQAAKVIVAVKDAIPAILCGKIKGLSGVSTKNFSIKRDRSGGGGAGGGCVGAQGSGALQQLCGAAPRPMGQEQQQHDPNDLLRKLPKNRAIKLKKVSSQEIHILPIKKQRLADFLPRK